MFKYRIAIIVTWFGKRPDYFDAWLLSAEVNKDIDFLIFSDQKIESNSDNIVSTQLSFNDMVQLCKKKMGRKVIFENSYKFCDSRAFFGRIFEEYLVHYDFWAYCDIDLIFGNLRTFLTDELLDTFDRVFQYGHLCLFRNNRIMNYLYDLPGGIYSMKDIFEGKAKTTPEEYWGLNRICEKNNISWYTEVVFADFSPIYPQRLELGHKLENFDEQIFIWKDGHAYQIYRCGDTIKKKEFIYMHWQKKKPIIEGDLKNAKMIILSPHKLYCINEEIELNNINFEKYNPAMSKQEKKQAKKEYRNRKLKEFWNASLPTKRMWLRQKRYTLFSKRNYE